MEYIVNLFKLDFIDDICRLPVDEVLLQSKEFSRVGGVELSNLPGAFDLLKKHGKKVVLAWDHLIKDNDIEKQQVEFERIINSIDSVRILDPGLGAYLQQNFPQVKLQLSLEHGSFNSLAIEGWLQALKPQVERVVLSPQIPSKTISRIVQTVSTGIEVLIYGELEMFYSRRKLLPSEEQTQSLTISSDDRPGQKNRIIQTSKGTIVYYDRTLNLSSKVSAIIKEGIQYLRLEGYSGEQLDWIKQYLNQTPRNRQISVAEDPIRETSGFYEKNLTDKLFRNLTNRHLSEEAERKIGSVLESVKNEYTVLLLQSEIDLPCTIKIISPEGKNVERKVDELTDLKMQSSTDKALAGIYQIPWIKFAVPGSLVTLL